MKSYAKLKALIALGEPQRAAMVLAVAISFVEIAANLLFPILTRALIDDLPRSAAAGATAVLGPQVLMLLAVVLTGAIAASVSGFILRRSAQKIGRALKRRIFVDLLRQPVAFFDVTESGELVSRITTDTQVIAMIGTKYLAGLINGVLLLTGSAIILMLLDPPLTLAILLIIALSFLVMAPSFMRVSSITRDMNEARAKVSAGVSRVFGEVRLVKALGAEKEEADKIGERLQVDYEAGIRFAKVEALLTPINGLALTAAMVAIFSYGAARVVSGAMTIGTLTVFMLYIFNFVGPLIQISTFLTQFQTALGSSSHLYDLIRQEGDPPGRPAPVPSATPPPGQGIRIENVEFSYPSRAGVQLSLDGVEFPAGSATAIIGASGAGKTTLFSLLERFYPLEQGRILYGGVDIADLDLDDWRRRIGYVSQSAPLMSGTIRENILYGSEAPHSEERLLHAARAANCADFIADLPDGFDTAVGEGGTLLSGGQKQRIAIARMFYRDPEIVLLDEATANLDEQNEAAVLRSVTALIGGRTSIIITHRLSTLSAVDRVLLFEGGTVAETLTPEEVIGRSDIYRRALEPAGFGDGDDAEALGGAEPAQS